MSCLPEFSSRTKPQLLTWELTQWLILHWLSSFSCQSFFHLPNKLFTPSSLTLASCQGSPTQGKLPSSCVTKVSRCLFKVCNTEPWGLLSPLPALYCGLPGLVNPARGGNGHRGSAMVGYTLTHAPSPQPRSWKDAKLGKGSGGLEPP